VRRFSHLFLTSILALGCSSQSDTGSDGEDTADNKNDQISSFDDPNSLIPNAKTLLKDNLVASDVGKTFGTPDDDTPYPDTYWPFVDEGIDNNWTGDAAGSPLEKYMGLFDPSHKDAAKKWEKKNHGSEVPGVADWFGHCPGWTGAAMDNAPLKHAVNVKPDGDGGVNKCKEGSDGCVKLEIGDINALQAEVYVDGDSSFIGARCDTKPKDIERDRNGRIVRNGGGCQGLNPGALLIVMGNVMKHSKKAFAIDAQNDFNTDQIWNQPAYRYHVYKFESLSEKEAANLVAHGTKSGDRVRYTWNRNAKGWALVDFGLNWVSEMGPNTDVVSGKQSTKETRMVAVIELSDKASSDSARIIGGEYLNDASVGASRLSVPPFVWMIRGAGSEDLPTSVGGDNHNPYVKPSLVAQLITLAQE
jgi:transglutaminase elicitor